MESDQDQCMLAVRLFREVASPDTLLPKANQYT
jgi:hypothetical protein